MLNFQSQCDNFTRVPNKFIEMLYEKSFRKRQLIILALIYRETFGFNRDKVPMSLTYISKKTHVNRSDISKTLKELQKIGVLAVEMGKGKCSSIISLVLANHQQSVGKSPILQCQNTNSIPSSLKKPLKETNNSNYPDSKEVLKKMGML